MYILCESALCVGVTLVVATCLFGLCVVFLLLQEGTRQMRLLVGRTVSPARRLALQSLVLQPLAVRWSDHPSTRTISNIAR